MEQYVDRVEFNQLKEEVNDIKKEMAESQKLLGQIDKKIDIINEKIMTSDKVEILRLQPLEKRVDILEDNQKWLRRTVIGAVLSIVGEAVVFVIQLMKWLTRSKFYGILKKKGVLLWKEKKEH